MRAQTFDDRVLVAPEDEFVDQSIRAAVGNVVLGEAEPEQVLHVVLGSEVPLDLGAGLGPSDVGVGFEHDLVLDHEQRVGAHDLAGTARVVDRHEIRVSAERALRGETQHRWAQAGQYDVDRRLVIAEQHGVTGLVHRVEVSAHGGHRLLVHVATRGDQRPVADAEAEDEAVTGCVGQRARRLHGCAGIARPDAGDAGRDMQALRRCEQRGGIGVRLVAVERLGIPEAPVSGRFDRLCCCAHGRGRGVGEPERPRAPRPDRAADPCAVGGEVGGHQERVGRIELPYSAWKAAALPLSYTRGTARTPCWSRSVRGCRRCTRHQIDVCASLSLELLAFETK